MVARAVDLRLIPGTFLLELPAVTETSGGRLVVEGMLLGRSRPWLLSLYNWPRIPT